MTPATRTCFTSSAPATTTHLIAGRTRDIRLSLLIVVSFLLALAASHAMAQSNNGFKFLNPATGGHIVYGPVPQQNTLPGAMGAMLHTVHVEFGDRPQISRLFQTRGSSSVAAFFTVTAKIRGGKQVAGLVIVSMPAGSGPTAALLYDDAASFATSEGSMMKQLNAVWPPPEKGTTTGAGQKSAASPLRQTPFPDNSGSVGLPEGWRITGGYQGTVHAEGPDGSEIHFGVGIPVMDPSNPQTRQMIQMETQGGRVPLPGLYVAYPYGDDPVRAFVNISAQTAQKYRRPAPSYNFTSKKSLGQGATGQCFLAEGTVDRHDGKGTFNAATTICISAPMSGNWFMTLYQNDVRPELAEQMRPTMEAIANSYKLNDAVINAETQQTISHIHQIGADSMARAKASNEAFDQQIAAHDRASDEQDRHNQDFSNYILDKTVIYDSEQNEHSTVYNKYADSLVQADPSRFQYVPTQDMLKGIDY